MLARLAREAQFLRHSLLDLLFPPRCANCRRVGAWLCASCKSKIAYLEPPLCERCGHPSSNPLCPSCRKHPLDIDGIRGITIFEGVMREAIHRFKYNRQLDLADTFADMLNDYLSIHNLPADTIIPVPLHPERERARGYNQASLIAHGLAARRRTPLWEDALQRVRATQPQVTLDAVARRENVRDAFVASERVAGMRVLLIDDVCTTGATMDACSAALKHSQAKSVWGLALARPRYSEEILTPHLERELAIRR